MKRVLALLLLVGVIGCRETVVAVEVTIPDATGQLGPAAGVTVMALPYDRDSLMAAMENEAPTPRPHTVELDSLFQVFRAPFAESTRLAMLMERLRDSLQALPVEASPRRSLEDSLAGLQRARQDASRRLDSVRAQVGPRIDSLRAEVRAWEAQAFRDWAETTSSLTSGRLVAGITDTTRHDGTTRLYLPPSGRSWWVYGRSFNSGDPNSEWYWNIPVTGPRLVLDTSTGRLRPRY